jgi:hypothetical protein
MSVLRADELPEPPALPAASPRDSARSLAVARWTEPAEPAATAPDHATRPAPVSAQATRPAPPRTQAASVPLRLTRRGRVVVAIAAAVLLAVLSLVIAVSAQATNHPLPSSGAQQHLTQVTVRPGQSLWSVAENADPGADTRAVIQQIVELNGLTGDVVVAGQRLWVPRG